METKHAIDRLYYMELWVRVKSQIHTNVVMK